MVLLLAIRRLGDFIHPGMRLQEKESQGPDRIADSDGKIRFRFNASDMLSGYTVTLEGISGDGKFISRQFKVENASK